MLSPRQLTWRCLLTVKKSFGLGVNVYIFGRTSMTFFTAESSKGYM